MFLTPSCTNLDEEFFSDLTTDNFPQTRGELIAALGSAYSNLYTYGNHNNYHSLIEVASDEAMIPQRGADWFDGGQWIRTHRHEYTSQEQAVNNAWNVMYRGIGICNDLIRTFQATKESEEPAVSAEEADAFIAETRALRALYYFWLMDAYGNIPIVVERESEDAELDLAPATNSRSEVFDFVTTELEEVAGLLPQEHGSSTYARVNYYTAQAILAKCYLNAEVYTGTARWADAANACREIINSNQFMLTDNYFDNFAADNDNGLSGTSENIFVIPFDATQAPGFNLHHMTLHYSSQATFQLQEQPWNGYCTLAEFYNSYEANDARRGEPGNQQSEGNFFAGQQFDINGNPLTDTGVEPEDPDGGEIFFTPEINELEPNALRQAGVRIHKFEIEEGAPNSLSADFPIFRYSDVLLMLAEALWRENPGSQEALDLVNQVRARAGVAEFSELNADNLLAERGREMFFEGWRRQDLIRFGRYNDPWFAKPASDPSKNIFPIPQAKLNTNPNLQQNPGY